MHYLCSLSYRRTSSIVSLYIFSSYICGSRSFAASASIGRHNMQVIRNDGHGGKGVIILPQTGAYTNVVIWFHGLGDTADGWAGSMPSLGIPDTKFILPTATTRPISLNFGMAMPGWSDVSGLDSSAPEDKEGFTSSSSRVEKIVQHEVDRGIDTKKIIIAGFSQGGALALHYSLRSKYSFGGCVALSTWLPFASEYPNALSEAAKTLPIFQAHGLSDQVVGHEWGLKSHELLKTLISQPEPQLLSIQGMAHSSHPTEMAAVSNFIKAAFSK